MDPIALTITDIRQETTDASTFFLQPAIPVSYQPGQFITLLVRHYGRDVRRSFSLSSIPGDPALAITVKRKSNGEISRYLLDHVKVGATLSALPPAGRFTFIPQPEEKRDVGFIAAGSGITPILPLIRQALDSEPGSHIWLLYQNHSEQDVIFGETLDNLAKQYADRFTLVYLFSAPDDHRILPRRLGNASLEQMIPGLLRFAPEGALFFCCGPEALMRMVRFTLRLLHFRADQFRQEHFTVDARPPAPLLTDNSPKKVTFRHGDQTSSFTVSYPENILQAALEHHIHLPYSCRGGRCSTCAVRCVSGRVVMSINDVLTDKDLEEGWVLTCTGYAATDLELEV